MNIKFFFYRAFKLIIFLFGKIFNLNLSKDDCGKIYLKFLSKFKKDFKHKYYGRTIYYDVNTDIGRELYLFGAFENYEIEVCGRYINEKSIVLDIGANIGLHSIYFALNTKGYVFSFEPSLDTFAKFLRNIKGLNNIFPFNFALLNVNKIEKFYETTDNAYSSLKDTKRKQIVKISNVICFKLDDLLMNLSLEKIDFVKIDVEGLEQQVLEGMENIIKKFKPVIFCEIFKGTNSNINPVETIKYLKNFGYKVHVVRENKIIEFKDYEDKYHNYFFLPIIADGIEK